MTFDIFDAARRWFGQVLVAEPIRAAQAYRPRPTRAAQTAVVLAAVVEMPFARFYRIEQRD